MIVAAALSGSVVVLALWGPLSSGGPKGLAVAVLAAVLFCHLLLAAGLQLYFFRYDSSTAVTVSSGGLDAHPALNASQSLAPLSQVRDAESQRPITESNLTDRRTSTAESGHPSSKDSASTNSQLEEKTKEPVPVAKDPVASRSESNSTLSQTIRPTTESSAQKSEHKTPELSPSSQKPVSEVKNNAP